MTEHCPKIRGSVSQSNIVTDFFKLKWVVMYPPRGKREGDFFLIKNLLVEERKKVASTIMHIDVGSLSVGDLAQMAGDK